MTIKEHKKDKKLAVIYHYFEADESYRDNFIFFLNTAINNCSRYFIYISGVCTVTLPELPNAEFYFIENKNFDFGALSEFSKHHACMDYDTYLFVNSSMRGPFLPEYYDKSWQAVLASRLTEKIALVGSSINLLPQDSETSLEFSKKTSYLAPFIHVQTTAYAMSSNIYKQMHRKGFYNINHNLNKLEAICYYELGLSQEIMKMGFKIAAILPTYDEFCLSKKTLDFEHNLKNGDPLNKSIFYGRSASPFEVLFVKPKRRALSQKELNSYTFTALAIAKKKFGLSSEGVELMKKAHKEALSDNEHGERINISLNDIQKMLKQIKSQRPDLAAGLRGLL